MNVNFIITCYDKESYWEHLKSIIESYEVIKPHIALCYNGLDENFKSDFRCEYRPNGGRGNDRHPSGCDYADADYELTVGGYDVLKNNGVHLWVKLSIDSWLLDEKKIIKILDNLISDDCAYGGSFWYENFNMSTDIFFANTITNNIFEDLKIYGVEFFDYLYSQPNPQGFEFLMTFMSRQYNRLIINQRQLLHNGLGHRWSCPELGWTMSHNLNDNILFKKEYVPNNNPITFSKIKGTGIQYSLENSKKEI